MFTVSWVHIAGIRPLYYPRLHIFAVKKRIISDQIIIQVPVSGKAPPAIVDK